MPRARAIMLQARCDAAQTPDADANHWAAADNLSADAANSPGVRNLLRKRSRYEVANGGYAKRMVRTKANDLIGTGPHLQMLAKRAPPNSGLSADQFNEDLEADWTRWMRATRFARTRWIAATAKVPGPNSRSAGPSGPGTRSSPRKAAKPQPYP